ncbi:CD36 family domain-containing protein [Phthorimaea operculella]|nr:CD36 family domain-containing protein [Phthorimaea operculella]
MVLLTANEPRARLQNKNVPVWSFVLGGLCLLVAGLLQVIDPIQIITTYSMRMEKGTQMYNFLMKKSEVVHLSMYLFNVTNGDAFLSGEDQTLKVQEVGPFSYREDRVNEELELDEEAGVVRYRPSITVSFMPEKSVAHPDNVTLTLPNLPLLLRILQLYAREVSGSPRQSHPHAAQPTAAGGVVLYRPSITVSFMPEKSVAHPDNVTLTLPNLPLLGLATMFSSYPFWMRSSLEVLTSTTGSKALITTDAGSYLWGYSDPIISLANKLAPNVYNFDKLGLLDRLYDRESPNYLEVSARQEDKFMIKTRNGHKKLNMGHMADPDQCETCNDFVNTYEGLGYPSAMTPETPLTLFRNGLCRTLPMDFHEKVVLDNGVHGLVFNISDNFYTQGQDENDDKILMLDLRKCFYDIPVALSKLYFEGLDPALYDRVEGVPAPDPNRGFYLVVEPMVAMQLETYVRVQLNLVLGDVSYNSKTRRFADMVLPIGYIEILQPPLPTETVDALILMHLWCLLIAVYDIKINAILSYLEHRFHCL